MEEQLRQIKMGWNRGFQLGLVAGGLGVLILSGVFLGFLAFGNYFHKDEIQQITKEEESEPIYGTECFEYNGFEDKWEKIGCWTDEEEKVIEEEKQKEIEEGRLEFERDRAKWLEDNPPVKELFDGNRRELEYTISYIRENWYYGDCALAWRSDVICWDFGGNKLIFPTERPEN